METLTLEKAQALVQEIIAENGGDKAKYEKPDPLYGCQYVHRFNADDEYMSSSAGFGIARREWGCLVGRVLGKAGVPIDWFGKDQENYFSISLHVGPLRNDGILDIDGDAAVYLRRVQREQDYGYTWVEADKTASSYMKAIS